MVTNRQQTLTRAGRSGSTVRASGRPFPRGRRTLMRARRLLTSTGALAVALLSSAGLTAASVPTAASGVSAGCDTATSAARVVKGAKVKEPALFDKSEANKYGVIKPHARMANGSVNIKTIFHVISDHALTSPENSRMNTMIGAQMLVLNDSYSGR